MIIFRSPNAIYRDGSTYDSISALVAAGDVDWIELDRAIIAAWTDWARRYGDALAGADAAQQIAQLQQTIAQQQAQLSQLIVSDWQGLQKALLEAGLAGLFADILALAKTTQNPEGESLETEALLLISEIDAAVRTGDRVTVVGAYWALLGSPTGEGFVAKLLGINPAAAPGLMALIQSTMPAVQQVLDDLGIPPNLLKFVD
jgi:hypothetical protein